MEQMNLDISGLRVAKWTEIALCGDQIGLVSEEGLVHLSRWSRDGKIEFLAALESQQGTGNLSISLSRHHLLTTADFGRHLLVWNLARRAVVAEFTAEGKARRVVATLATQRGKDLLLVGHREMLLEGYALDDMSKIIEANYEKPLALYIEDLSALMGDSDTFFILGHLFSEMKDSLYSFSLRALLGETDVATQKRMQGQREISDYAYRLAVGPCADNETVIFRDPEEDELPETESQEPLDDVENFRGLYVRRLHDGRLIERIPYDAPIKTGAQIFGTPSDIIVVCRNKLEIVPRRKIGRRIQSVPGEAFAIDPVYGRVALLSVNGCNVAILDSE